MSKPGRNCPTGENKKGERKKIRHEDRKKETARYTRDTDEDGRTVWHGLGVSDDSSCFLSIAFSAATAGTQQIQEQIRKHQHNASQLHLSLILVDIHTHLLTWLPCALRATTTVLSRTGALLFIFPIGVKGRGFSFCLIPFGGTDDILAIPSYNDAFLCFSIPSAVCVYLWLGFNVSVHVRFHT